MSNTSEVDNNVAAHTSAVLTAMLANPNVKMTVEEIESAMDRIAKRFRALSVPEVDAAPTAPAAKATAAEPAHVEPAPVEAKPARKPRVTAAKRLALSEKTWPGVEERLRAKFLELIDNNHLRTMPDGTPMPVRLAEALISSDKSRVMDPISGIYFSMLRHHCKTAYQITYEDMLVMFKLTPKQLPRTGPAYAASKQAAAKHMGLGKRNRDKASA